MAQVGAASSHSDTEAGPCCAWSIYTSKTQDSGDKVHNNNQPSVDLSNQEKNRQQMVKLEIIQDVFKGGQWCLKTWTGRPHTSFSQ